MDSWKPMKTEDELAALGVKRKSRNLIETFQSCDIVLAQLRSEVKKINTFTLVLTIFFVLSEVSIVLVYIFNPKESNAP